MRPIHKRMPVILDNLAADDWLNLTEADPLWLKRLLIPEPDDVSLTLISSADIDLTPSMTAPRCLGSFLAGPVMAIRSSD